MPKWVLKTPLSYNEVGQNHFSQSIQLKSLHAGSRIDVFYPLFPPLPSYCSEKIGRSACKMKVGPRGGKTDFREKWQIWGLRSIGGLIALCKPLRHIPQKNIFFVDRFRFFFV